MAAALLLGLLVRIAIGLTDDAPSTDETAYLRSGLSLIGGEGFQRSGQPELHFPPLVPFLLGVTSKVVSDPHTATVVLTCLSGAALVVPLALLGRRLAGPPAGVAAAWIAALAPGMATMPAARGAGSEAEYVVLVVGAVVSAIAAVGRRERAQLACAAAAGLLAGLAYLTRPEGLLVAVPLGVVIAAGAVRSRARVASRLAMVSAFAVPLALCLLPYVWFLHHHTGEWELTAKTHDASIDAWHAVARNDREARDEILYGLDESGQRFSSERSSLLTLVREDPSGYAGILITNAGSLVRNVAGWWLLPLPAWALAAVGAWRLRGNRVALLLGAVALVPVVTAMAFFVQPRYLMVTVGMAAVLAGAAVTTLSDRWRRPVAVGVGVALVASSLAAFYGDGGWWHPGDHTDQRRAGEWIASHTESDDRIMARSMVVEYYADRTTVAIPYASRDEILRVARRYGVEYLVVDQSHATRLRPQLVPLLDGPPPGGLHLVHEVVAEGRTTRVFALDPPPPDTADEGPALGFMADEPG